mgnify:CR=1 FL=1
MLDRLCWALAFWAVEFEGKSTLPCGDGRCGFAVMTCGKCCLLWGCLLGVRRGNHFEKKLVLEWIFDAILRLSDLQNNDLRLFDGTSVDLPIAIDLVCTNDIIGLQVEVLDTLDISAGNFNVELYVDDDVGDGRKLY